MPPPVEKRTFITSFSTTISCGAAFLAAARKSPSTATSRARRVESGVAAPSDSTTGAAATADESGTTGCVNSGWAA